MKKIISSTAIFMMVLNIFGNSFAAINSISSISGSQLTNINNTIQLKKINILQEGITAENAGTIIQEKTFTNGNLKLDNLKFEIISGAKLSLDSNIKNSFEISNKTRTNFNLSKNKNAFKATAKFSDKIIEYPDRVRVISQTEYTYNNKAEYDAIFTGTNNKNIIDENKVRAFLAKNPQFSEYANGLPKVNKKDIIEKLTDKFYSECLSRYRTNPTVCKKETLKNNITNTVNQYKGKRTVTETIDVNKIPMIYDGDTSVDFTQRLKNSNISQNPEDVRLSPTQITSAFTRYANIPNLNIPNDYSITDQTPETKNCDGLSGAALTLCTNELNLLNSNLTNTNSPITFSGTLLNGFTLGESYSYTLGDSYSILGFTVYDIGVSFYAGYGVGIRIPIDYNLQVNKNRLEKGVSENFTINISADTVDKDEAWFQSALGNNKAFEGKEAVLEAGAYAKGWIVLLDQTVFNGQLGGKYDWGKNLKIPFGSTERLELFSGIAEGQDFGLELILYGIHISGDLKVEGYIKGDISYECRTLAAQGLMADSLKCRDLDDTSLKDSDIPDIELDPVTKSNTLYLKGQSDKFYYKNNLGVYQNFGVDLQRFKYKPDLIIDLFLRGKIGVDTGDYFGWFWLTTPWLKVYTFELDLPTLLAHSGYSPKSIKTYENSYLYNFHTQEQDIPVGFDDSTETLGYSLGNPQIFKTVNGISANTQVTPYYAHLYGGKPFPNSIGDPVQQMNVGTNSDYYYNLITSSPIMTGINYHGYIRKTSSHLLRDYIVKKDTVELQTVTNNVGQSNNNVAFYYSNATNAIWGTNLGGGSLNVKKIKEKSLNDSKVLSLPGTDCSLELSGNEKFKNNRGEDCPVANDYDLFGGFEDNGGIIQAKDPTGFVIPYKKYNFAFHPQFNQSNKNIFAYIGYTSNKEVKKVKIYKNGQWGEIEDSIIGQPKYVQIIDENTLIIIFENINSTTNINSYTIQRYTFENQWISNRMYQKTFTDIPNVTDFYYDNENKTVYVSALEKNNSQIFNGVLYSIRFNGIENTPFKQKIFTAESNQELFVKDFHNLWPSGSWNINSVTENGSNPVHTAISAFNVDLANQTIYMNTYAFNGKNSSQYITKVNYITTPMLLADPVETYSEDDDEDNQDDQEESNRPRPQTNNVDLPFFGSGDNQSGTGKIENDEYIDFKLDELSDCYAQLYSSHIKDIEDTIAKFQGIIKNRLSAEEKEKYIQAIEKLKLLKSIYERKYGSINK